MALSSYNQHCVVLINCLPVGQEQPKTLQTSPRGVVPLNDHYGCAPLGAQKPSSLQSTLQKMDTVQIHLLAH